MEIHYLWVGLACLVMVLSKAARTAHTEPRQDFNGQEHGFDLGKLLCCALPQPRPDICPEMSDHIPCTIYNDMQRRESRIRKTVHAASQLFSSNCSESIREVLCKQNFPTCVINSDGSHEVQLPARRTCKEAVCETLRDNQYVEQVVCSLYEPTGTTYPVGNCSLPRVTDFEFNHCKVDWYIPAWLVQYVKQIDSELEMLQNNLGLSNNSLGWEQLKDVRCKSVGRCWAQGDRLEHILSTEMCNDALNEVDVDVQRVFSPILGCEFLPKESARTATRSTDITLTPPTMQAPSVTTLSTDTLPIELEGSTLTLSASISLQTVLVLAILYTTCSL